MKLAQPLMLTRRPTIGPGSPRNRRPSHSTNGASAHREIHGLTSDAVQGRRDCQTAWRSQTDAAGHPAGHESFPLHESPQRAPSVHRQLDRQARSRPLHIPPDPTGPPTPPKTGARPVHYAIRLCNEGAQQIHSAFGERGERPKTRVM